MDTIWHDLTWVLPLRSDGATVVMRAVSWMGYSTFYMLFLPLGFWVWRKPAFTRLAIMVALSGVLNAWLKDYWQDPRPDIAMSLDGLVGESYGLPSGHAQVSTVLWLWLAHEVRRWWMWALATLIIGAMIFSRLYLGVHDLEDVVAGFAIAMLSVGVAIMVSRAVSLPYAQLALILLAGQAVVFTLWPEGGPGAITGYGAFAVAWLTGAALEARKVGYSPAEGWRRVAAGALGIVILMALFVGFSKGAKAIDPDGDAAMYVATVIVGLYMTFGAPWLFRRVGLAGPRAPLHGSPST